MHTASVAARQTPCTLAVSELRTRRWPRVAGHGGARASRCRVRSWTPPGPIHGSGIPHGVTLRARPGEPRWWWKKPRPLTAGRPPRCGEPLGPARLVLLAACAQRACGNPAGKWLRGWTIGPSGAMFRTAVDEPARGSLRARLAFCQPGASCPDRLALGPGRCLPGGLASPHEAPRRMRPAPRCPRRRAGRSTAHRSAWTRCRYAAAGGKAKRGSPVTLHRGVLPGLGRAGPQP